MGEASNIPLLEAPPMPLEYGVVKLSISVTLQPLANRERDMRGVAALAIWYNENLIALPPTAKIKKKYKCIRWEKVALFAKTTGTGVKRGNRPGWFIIEGILDERNNRQWLVIKLNYLAR